VADENICSDYAGKRQGNRVVSLGEKPYYDPSSVSRREALQQGLEATSMILSGRTAPEEGECFTGAKLCNSGNPTVP
jgi:hypothetical protein